MRVERAASKGMHGGVVVVVVFINIIIIIITSHAASLKRIDSRAFLQTVMLS